MNKQSLLLYKELLGLLNTVPLSQTMPIALRLARELGDVDFEKWLRLEIGGYFNNNPALTADVKVPEYRNVAGQHLDKYGRPLLAPLNAQFINNIPLRNGIDELEKMASDSQMLTIQNPLSIKLIREMFNVEAYVFRFHTMQITGILSSIKLKLNDLLFDVQRSHPELSSALAKEISRPSESHQPIQITVGNGASVGNLVVAHSIDNSFNKLESAEIPADLKNALKELANAVSTMTSAMTNEVAEQVARDLETLTAEAISKSPRKEWWQLSVDGLKKAATNIGELGKPVIELISRILPLLLAISNTK